MICLLGIGFCSLLHSFEKNVVRVAATEVGKQGAEKLTCWDWGSAAKSIELGKREYRGLYQHALWPICHGTPDSTHHSESPSYRTPYLDDCRGVLTRTCIVACGYPLPSRLSNLAGPAMLG